MWVFSILQFAGYTVINVRWNVFPHRVISEFSRFTENLFIGHLCA